jgi:hypothetical protein
MYEKSNGITDSKLRIAIIMLNSPNISSYAHFAALNNYLYTIDKGYDFIVERLPQDIKNDWTYDPNNEYVWVWYKAELIKKHLKNYNYVLYIDSDAFINDGKYKIEDVLLPMLDNEEKVIIFQEDVWNSTIPIDYEPNKICTGLVFVKNCQKAFDILDLWIKAPYIDEKCYKFRYNHPREQGCIQYLRDKDDYDIKKNIVIFPAKLGFFGQYDSKWIIHMGGTNKKNRIELISSHHKANFEKFRQVAIQEFYQIN